MLKYLFVLLIISNSYAQDERYFRDLFSGNLTKDKFQEKKKYKWEVQTPYYEIDLNGDPWKESIVYKKKDGEDWVHIYDMYKNEIFSQRFYNEGWDSRLVKISSHKISKSSRLLILYYYEGYTHYLNFLGTARLYFITLDNDDLKTIKMIKGPLAFFEEEQRYKNYFKRKYHVSLNDLDGDGTRDVIVKHHKIARTYFYRGNGRWFAP